MKRESDYVTILCGEFEDNYSPLTRAEFWKLYHKYGDTVDGIIGSGEDKVEELLKRSAAVAFSLERMEQVGIRINTFLDEGFPERVYSKLKDFCPPLLYTCGETAIKQGKFAGYVGSRTIGEEDIRWTEMMVEKNVEDGFGIVTGGAKGIDSVSMNYALNQGSQAIVFLPDNITAKLKDSFYQRNILDGRLLVYSHVSPFAKKTKNTFVASAMERNKLIYGQSIATAVVKSDLNKGGTWAGATEALKHCWAHVFVWDNKNYAGNQKLIELGAKPLSDAGKALKPEIIQNAEKKGEAKQLSIFDFIGKSL